MEREKIRNIVLAETDLFKGLVGGQEFIPSSKLATLELLTRPEMYDANPEDVQESIDSGFKELAEMNAAVVSTILLGLGLSACGCCDDEDPFEGIDDIDEDDKKQLQFMVDFIEFISNNPAAFGMGEESQVAETFKKLKESFDNRDKSLLQEGVEMFQGLLMSGIVSCVKAYVEDVDQDSKTIVFDFIDDEDHKKFCEFLGVPMKSESMIRATNCEFWDNYPEADTEYLLNIVDLKDEEVPFKEITDHACIGLEMNLSGIDYNPFRDPKDED